MTSALRYEWRRVTTVLSTWIMAALAILVVVGVASLLAAVNQNSGEFPNEASTLAPGSLGTFVSVVVQIAAVFLSVIAAQAVGQDYRHGMIRLTLSAFPKRSRILSAKLLMMLIVIVSIALVAFVVASAAALLIAHPPIDVESLVIMGKGIVVLMLYCTIVFALTILTRILALGIIIPVVLALVIEPILVGIAFLADKEWIARILPFQRAFSDLSAEGGWTAIGILAVWAVGIMAIAWVVFERRDA